MRHLWVVAFIAAVAVGVSEAQAAYWPIYPHDGPHPIRSSVLDPRDTRPGSAEAFQFHKGVDIVTDDDECDPAAPPGRCQLVRSVAPGKTWFRYPRRDFRCNEQVRIGRFTYSHVDTTIRVGQHVRKGQRVGWTCRGTWHLHFSERAAPRSSRFYNPVRPGGVLSNFYEADTVAPRIMDGRWADGELWVRIEDPVPAHRMSVEEAQAAEMMVLRIPGSVYSPFPPYTIRVNGVLRLSSWAVDGNGSFYELFAPPTTASPRVSWCAERKHEQHCYGEFWFRLGSPSRPVTVEAADGAGNKTTVEIN